MFTPPCIFSLKSRPLPRTPLVERGFAEHSVSENLPLSYSKTLLSALFSSPLLCSPPNASPFPHLTLRHEEFTQKSTPDPFGTHRFYSEHKVWWCRCMFCVCVHPVCVYPRVLGSLYVKRLHLRESLVFFFFPSSQCLGAGLGSKGSVCQYLVIVSASIFISHSVWSLSPRVQPNYITWPCPVPLTPTPYAALNRDAAVAGFVSQRDQ